MVSIWHCSARWYYRSVLRCTENDRGSEAFGMIGFGFWPLCWEMYNFFPFFILAVVNVWKGHKGETTEGREQLKHMFVLQHSSKSRHGEFIFSFLRNLRTILTRCIGSVMERRRYPRIPSFSKQQGIRTASKAHNAAPVIANEPP